MRLAEHQQEAVARAVEIIRSHGGAILADDVGLGKTLVAAWVGRELGRPIDLIVPRGLVTQWQEAMREAGVCASVETHDRLRNVPFVPDPARRRLVIVDEAHAFRNPATQRYDALCRRSVGGDVLLVTATPVCNSARDLHALLSLIAADDALAACGIASIDAAFAARDRAAVATIVSQLVIRRGRSVLPDSLQFGTLVRSVIRHSLFDPDAKVSAAIASLQFPLIGSAPLLRRLLWRRLESSEAAILESIQRQLRFYDRALDGIAHGRVLTKREYRHAFSADEDGDAFQQVLFWDLWAPPAAGVSAAEVQAEVERLQVLRRTVAMSPQEKRRALLELLVATCEPVIVFTTAAATARDLYNAAKGIRRTGLATARWGHNAIGAFRDGAVDVLVATDLASEGLNLQRAGAVVHYDIPWNPVKLDQRNGRAWRIGQERESVRATYFVPSTNVTGVMPIVREKRRESRRTFEPHRETARNAASTLPPRVTRDAPIVRFAEALEKRGLHVPDALERRNKAGVDRLIAAMAGEYLDTRRLEELVALVAGEAGGSSETRNDER